jgi:hypothetical protein
MTWWPTEELIMGMPGYVYFAITLGLTAVGMLCNTVAWAREKRRMGHR